jgi:hypothetical protein
MQRVSAATARGAATAGGNRLRTAAGPQRPESVATRARPVITGGAEKERAWQLGYVSTAFSPGARRVVSMAHRATSPGQPLLRWLVIANNSRGLVDALCVKKQKTTHTP